MCFHPTKAVLRHLHVYGNHVHHSLQGRAYDKQAMCIAVATSVALICASSLSWLNSGSRVEMAPVESIGMGISLATGYGQEAYHTYRGRFTYIRPVQLLCGMMMDLTGMLPG